MRFGLGCVIGVVIAAVPWFWAPVVHASAAGFCDELGANWDGTACTTSVHSVRQADMNISLQLPAELMDNPVAGPLLRAYHHKLIEAWRKTGAAMIRDSVATTDYQLTPGPGAIQSLVIHELFQPAGTQANNAYRPFIFDMSKGRRIGLADLFKAGVDPLAAIAPAARELLPAALDAAPPPHVAGSYPFTVDQWEPGAKYGGYSGNYRGFGLTPDSLVLYLPDAPTAHQDDIERNRFVWSMDGGAVIIHVPLRSLAASLRPEYGGD